MSTFVVQQAKLSPACQQHAYRAESCALTSKWDRWQWRWLECWPRQGCGTSAFRPAGTLAPGCAHAPARSSLAAPQYTATCCLRITSQEQMVIL